MGERSANDNQIVQKTHFFYPVNGVAGLDEQFGVDGRGIELSREGVNRCVAEGLAVIQGDADTDLAFYPDDAFDVVVPSLAVASGGAAALVGAASLAVATATRAKAGSADSGEPAASSRMTGRSIPPKR